MKKQKNYIVQKETTKKNLVELIEVRAKNKTIAEKIVRAQIFRATGAAGFKGVKIKVKLKEKKPAGVQLELFTL